MWYYIQADRKNYIRSNCVFCMPGGLKKLFLKKLKKVLTNKISYGILDFVADDGGSYVGA